MTTIKRTTVVGVFDDRAQAREAVDQLRRANFGESQIGVITAERDEHGPVVEKATGNKAAEGASIGAVAGAGVGTVWALGVAATVFPPLGFIAGGTLMAILASAGIGAAAAGIGGALIGLGVPEHEARYYEGEWKAGRTLVTVSGEARAPEALAILRRCGAYDIETRGKVVAVAD